MPAELYAASGTITLDGNGIDEILVIGTINNQTVSTTTNAQGVYVLQFAGLNWNEDDEFIIETNYTNNDITYIGYQGAYIKGIGSESDINISLSEKSCFNFFDIWKMKGRKITFYTNTNTDSNISADPHRTYSDGSIRKHVFIEKDNVYERFQDGQIHNSDAILIMPPGESVNRHDRIKAGDTFYLIDNFKTKSDAGIDINITCNLIREGD